MQAEALFFINSGSVVRGRMKARHRNRTITVIGEHYVRPDGTEAPIYLGFTRRLAVDEITREAEPLLALVAALPRKENDE
jgi:hypothetical protein